MNNQLQPCPFCNTDKGVEHRPEIITDGEGSISCRKCYRIYPASVWQAPRALVNDLRNELSVCAAFRDSMFQEITDLKIGLQRQDEIRKSREARAFLFGNQ